MPLQVQLNVAWVNYTVFSQNAAVLGPRGPAYGSFLGSADGRREIIRVEVRLELGDGPLPSDLTEAFDSGDSWTISSDGDSRWLRFCLPQLARRHLWLAQISRDFASVTVYCGDEMIRNAGPAVSVVNPVSYPLDQILLMHILARHEGALIHAAGVRVDGRALIFPGKSGAGKSTLSRCLAERDGLELLSDDRIAVRKIGDAFIAYGTPWPGDQGAALNEKAPLAGIFFLRHADADSIVPLEPREAIERLLPVTSVPWYDAEAVSGVLAFCDQLLTHVPAFELHFRPGAHVAELVEEVA